MLQQFQANIPTIICKLEMIFPPVFFDIMVHLDIYPTNQWDFASNSCSIQVDVTFQEVFEKVQEVVHSQ